MPPHYAPSAWAQSQPDEPKAVEQANASGSQEQAQSTRLLAGIAHQIQQLSSVEALLDEAIAQIRQFLGCDRALAYRLEADGSGTVVAEALAAGCTSLLGHKIDDPCFGPDWIEPYTNGRVRVVPDVQAAGMAPCHRQMLEQIQVRAKIVVPLVRNGRLWGLLTVQQCRAPRQWQQAEVDLLEQLATQVAVGLQQAYLLERQQQELAERQRAQAALAESERRFRAIFNNSFQFMGLLSPDGTLLEANETAQAFTGLSREAMVGRFGSFTAGRTQRAGRSCKRRSNGQPKASWFATKLKLRGAMAESPPSTFRFAPSRTPPAGSATSSRKGATSASASGPRTRCAPPKSASARSARAPL